MLIVDLLLILLFSFLLMRSTELMVGALNRLSNYTKLGTFGLTAFLVALSTSLPELMVGVTAAIEGNPGLSLGNVLGSNIANLSLVIGGAALIGGTIGVVGEFLRKDFFTAFLAGALPLLLLLDGRLSKVDGVALLSVYVIYNMETLWGRREYMGKRQAGIFRRLLRRVGDWNADRELIWLVLGSALLVIAADMLVRVASRVASDFGVPMFLVGLFLVAVGTSLPELSFELGAVKRKEIGMVYGNLLGSIVANSTLVLGVTALFSPIKLRNGLQSYLVATMAFVMVFGLFWLFANSKKKLERWEGVVLLVVYLVFILVEFSRFR